LNVPEAPERAAAAVDAARRRALAGKIWLVGFMGSGKTTLAQILARRLHLPFFDLDTEIEKASGKTVRAIFEAEGEPEFRRLERAFVEGAESISRGVFATGGGTFVPEENRRSILRSGLAIFLDVPFEALLGRLAGKTDRPLFQDEAQARRLFEERLPFYKMAPVHHKLSGAEAPEAAAESLLKGLDERTCVI
jgi:shikimate kinase